METRTRLRPRLEGEIEYFTERHHRVEAHGLAHVLWDVVEVGAVPLGNDHVGEPRRVRGEHLLLEAPDR